MWSAIVTFISTIINFFLNRKKSEQQQTIETANEASRASADITRQDEQATEHDITESEKQTDTAIADLHCADSVRSKNRIAAEAINRANRPMR
ncbi:hypothetical protein [Sodalis ligni]|uniref:Uncharacterized protein n=1 Tax=Sodalis ligni TaxID=2697027 RepID=A0A4R1NGR0_9GAMM|nr:hypothetical protein [Sodalis ligni]TCL06885.1 hypothetical protein EZJ58_5182 [Sodalis ligni]